MELSLLTAKTSLDRSLIEVGGEGSLEGGSLWSQDKLITILIAQLEGGDELALYVTASLSKPRLQAHLSRASPDRQTESNRSDYGCHDKVCVPVRFCLPV